MFSNIGWPTGAGCQLLVINPGAVKGDRKDETGCHLAARCRLGRGLTIAGASPLGSAKKLFRADRAYFEIS